MGLEQTLLKSFVMFYRRRRQSKSRADIETLTTLMSVCDYWRRLVDKLLSQLKALVIKGMPLSHSLRDGSKGAEGATPPVRDVPLPNKIFVECNWASEMKNSDYMLVFWQKQHI